MIKKIIALSLCAVSLAHGVWVYVNYVGGRMMALTQYNNVTTLNNALRVPGQNPSSLIKVSTIDQNGQVRVWLFPLIVGRFLTQHEFQQLNNGDIISVY